MDTGEVITKINAFADYNTALVMRGEQAPTSWDTRPEAKQFHALKKAAGAAIDIMDEWTEVENRGNGIVVLQDDTGTKILYTPEHGAERVTIIE